jgi:excisionase family DNA binding protein
MPRQKTTVQLAETLRIGEAAKLLGISKMTLRRWDNQGLLKALKMGARGDRRYRKEDILKVLEHGLEPKTT